MPYFSERGYKCYAMSLRGHGTSEGSETLLRARVVDYLEDVSRIIEELGEIPILVGHSLGGMLIQKYLEHQPAPAAVLISTPTPKSMKAASFKLYRHFPLQMLKMVLSMNPDHVYKDPRLAKTLFFSESLSDEKFSGFFNRLVRQSESYRLFFDVLLLKIRKPVQNIPVLVIGGGRDWGVNRIAFRETAARYNTQPVIFDTMPHDMIVESDWKIVADHILEWLNKQGL